MPYKILKNKDKNTYKLVLVSSGKVLSKSTSKTKAQKQIKAIEINKSKNKECSCNSHKK